MSDLTRTLSHPRYLVARTVLGVLLLLVGTAELLVGNEDQHKGAIIIVILGIYNMAVAQYRLRAQRLT
jgi:hypothetical protein